jgi:hypothetical protein
MSLNKYALTSTDEALAYLGVSPRKNALWVSATATDATAATVEASSAALTLIITGGTDGGTTTFTFTDPDYNTMVELVAGINATSGWSAGLLCAEQSDSAYLVSTGSMACLNAPTTLQTIDAWTVERLIERASDYIERYCNRKFVARQYTNEVYWGNDNPRLVLDQYPVNRVNSIKCGRTTAGLIACSNAASTAYIEITDTSFILTADNVTVATLKLSDYANIGLLRDAINAVPGWYLELYGIYFANNIYVSNLQTTELLPSYGARWDCYPRRLGIEVTNFYLDYYLFEKGPGSDERRNPGILYYPSGFSRSLEYFITYWAGYQQIPYELELACLELVKFKYNMISKDLALKEERLGDYTYTLADFKNGMPEQVRAELAQFKKVVI